jgi:hypothetical protein
MMSSLLNRPANVLKDVASPDFREAFEHCFAGTLISMDPDLLALDPAERLEFSRLRGLSVGNIARFDTRSDLLLRSTMIDHADALQRERAAWEFTDRKRLHALPELRDMLKREPDSHVRRGLLWLAQKNCGLRALQLFKEFLHDDDVEVREWAAMLLHESSGQQDTIRIERPVKRNPQNTFDQTLPLVIAGYARTLVPSLGWVQVTLSPKWFELILGRVLACTCESTFDTDLVIEKKLDKFHPDGSDHFEIFKFRGFSHALDQQTTHHQYESFTNHTFYPSGKVEDLACDPVDDMYVILNRVAATSLAVDPVDPSRTVIQSVRGRYMGWAHINLGRMVANDMQLGPGEVQLCSLHHPTHGKLTNTFLYGSFKGKLSDLDGDGLLDVNTEPCHGNREGKLDYFVDGTLRADPFDACPAK